MQVRTIVSTVGLALTVLFGAQRASAQYEVTNLVSNEEEIVKAPDLLLMNAWGLTHGPGGPWWVSDNTSGWSTLYNGAGGKVPLDVSIPTASGNGPGMPTGIVFNGSGEFNIGGGTPFFIFDTLDGTISGWVPSVNRNAAAIAITKPGASYTALAITNKVSGNLLYAVDNAGKTVDVYDGSFKLKRSFTDTTLPADFAPFGIQDFGGLLYVAFASSTGKAGGAIDIFSEGGVLLKHLATGNPLNQPWGMAIAPKDFGPLSNALLVSNNTNTGTINAFNAVTGQFVGTLKDTKGAVIQIDQLWGIGFGDGLGKMVPRTSSTSPPGLTTISMDCSE